MSANKNTPPKAAIRFLKWFLRDDLAEEVQGDLEEQYYDILKHASIFQARLIYWFQVINYLRPFAISKSSPTILISKAMFRNYFKISVRNLYKQKLYAAINIGGLAVGLTCFLLIFLFVQYELSFDRVFSNGDRIYRIIYQYPPDEVNAQQGMKYIASSPAPLASTLMNEFPEVNVATSVDERSALLGLQKNDLYLEQGLLADSSFFEVFDFYFIHGKSKVALDNPRTIVLTESLSKKIFGALNPVGKAIIYQVGNNYGASEDKQNEDPYTVTGVIKDPPENISFKFSFIASLASDSFYAEEINSWGTFFLHTFLLLPEATDHLVLQEKLPLAMDKYDEESREYIVQPIADMHLQSHNIAHDLGPKVNPKYIYLFSGIALIVLLLASANYMNLAIARSASRSREVGLRKAVGAVRQQLIIQFLGESVLLAFMALILALGLTYLILPVFADLVERPVELNFIENKWMVPSLLSLVVAVGLLSGSYPALYMSSLRPFQVLKGKIENRATRIDLQKFLIVLQYTVSVILIIGSIVIYRQLQFIQNKELGYDKEHVITVTVRDDSLLQKFDVIRAELLQNHQIVAITKSSQLPVNIRSFISRDLEGEGKEKDKIAFYGNSVDQDFFRVFNIKLVAGRDFSQAVNEKVKVCVINEAAAKTFGWSSEEAIGNDYFGSTIIGVLKDFHMHSLHTAIQPLSLYLNYDGGRNISLKIRPENISETVGMVEKTFKKYSSYPFEYAFLDDKFN